MPTWRELIEKIETEEQARGFVQAIRGYAERNYNALKMHMESVIKGDYKAHPDHYIDEKTGKPYTPDKLEDKLDEMIADEKPKELFDQSTSDRMKIYGHFIQSTAILEQAFNMGDYQEDFTDGMLNENGRNDMQNLLGKALDDYEALVTEYAEIYSEIKTEAMWTVAPRLNTNASNAFMQINDVMGPCIGLWERGSEEDQAMIQSQGCPRTPIAVPGMHMEKKSLPSHLIRNVSARHLSLENRWTNLSQTGQWMRLIPMCRHLRKVSLTW